MSAPSPEVVTVYFHEEDGGGWSGESPDAPGYMAYGRTIEECRQLVHEGLAFFLERPVAIYDPAQSLTAFQSAATSLQGTAPFAPVLWALDYPGEDRLGGLDPGLGIPGKRAPAAA